MPTHERSQSGCWTCRARKKKCDECYPVCTSCEVRGITCHYGLRPEWMDGAVREKRVLSEFQRIIKENLKKRRSYQHSTTPRHHIQPPRPVQNIEIDLSSIFQAKAFDETQSGRPASNASISHYGLKEPGANSIPSPPDSTFTAPSYCDGGPDAEPTLLMHYLDSVFPLQFTCYTPPVTELGRGWLLALLTRTKPLYHIALALGAYYMQDALSKTNRKQCRQKFVEASEKHHAIAFRELQTQIAGLSCPTEMSLRGTIETLACIIQMISFELFRGSSCFDSNREGIKNCWKIHLGAAASLIPTLIAHLNPHGTEAPRKSDLYTRKAHGIFHASDDAPPATDDIACDFLIGTFLTFDILATASTRCPPHLQDNIFHLVPVELATLMGCESWAMILISQISTLAASRSSLSEAEFLARGAEIDRQLREGLQQNEIETGIPLLKEERPACQRLGVPQVKTILIFTRIYAIAALIYLHCTLSGPDPELPIMRELVRSSVGAFGMLGDDMLMRSLVWPFCVTGCLVGSGEEVEGIRKEFGKAVERVGNLGRTGTLFKAWDVTRECWRLREEEGRLVDWVDGMDSLGVKVLLV